MYDFIQINYSLLFITYSLGILFIYICFKLKIFSHINLLMIVIIGLYLFQVIGLPFSQGINETLLNYSVDNSLKYRQIMVVFLGLLFLLIGYQLIRIRKTSTDTIPNNITVVNRPLLIVVYTIFSFYALCSIFITFEVITIYNPIYFIQGHIQGSMAENRFFIYSIISEKPLYWFFDKSLYGVMPALTFLTIYLQKHNLRGKNYVALLLIIIVITNSTMAQKSRLLLPLVYLIVGLWFVRNFKNVFELNLFQYLPKLALTILGFGIIISFLYTKQYEMSFTNGLQAFCYRVFIENARVLELYLAFYPNDHLFLHGGATQLIRDVFGLSGHNPDQYLPWVIFGQPYTSWPTSYLGCAWADFGVWGVITYSLCIGIFLAIIDKWIREWSFCPVRMSFYFAILIDCFNISAVNMFTAFLQGGVLLNLVHIGIAILISSLLPFRYKPDIQNNCDNESRGF